MTTASLATGSFSFEYIAEGEAKVELREMSSAASTATGTLVAVDDNGSNDATNNTRTYFYAAAGTTYDTGVGLKIDMAAFANIATGSDQYSQFTYSDEAMDVDVSTAGKATDYMATLDTAIQTVSDTLNSIGSLVARLDAKEEAVGVAQVNTEAAYNRIVNADMALEQVEASKFMILQQTAIAMLAQSNMAPQGILSLFR
jgi:flagellin